MSDNTLDLPVVKGKTFRNVLRWGTLPYIYVALAGISKAAPCVVTTADTHTIPDDWPVAVISAGGMKEINAPSSPPADDQYRRATYKDATHIEFNELDASGFTAYTTGGYLIYRTPVDLTNYKGRLQIRTKDGATLLYEMTTENGGIVITPASFKIELVIPADDSAAFDWKQGYYDLELYDDTVSPVEVVGLVAGKVTVEKEYTTA